MTDFSVPEHLPALLAEMDAFIEAEIKPLEREHMQYFDRRREFARTDLENGGIPNRDWEDLLDEMRRRADAAGWLRYGLPSKFGGRDGTNLDMAVIREHLAHKGLGLHNDLQDESSIIGNFPQVIMMDRFGTPPFSRSVRANSRRRSKYCMCSRSSGLISASMNASISASRAGRCSGTEKSVIEQSPILSSIDRRGSSARSWIVCSRPRHPIVPRTR